MVKGFGNLVLREKSEGIEKFPLGERRLRSNGITDFKDLKG